MRDGSERPSAASTMWTPAARCSPAGPGQVSEGGHLPSGGGPGGGPGAGERRGLCGGHLPRKNAFSRPAVANIDQLVVIASGAIPKTDPFLIDRVAAIAALKGCSVMVLLNKCDLDCADALYAVYAAAGFPTLRVSAETRGGDRGIEAPDRWEAVCLYREFRCGKVQHPECPGSGVSAPGGGCEPGAGPGTPHHPARGAVPPELRGGRCGLPGFSSFETDELNLELKHRLPETFVEFRPYLDQCRFVGCSHTKEKGCAVLEAVRAGKIQRSRHASYVRLYEELKPLQDWQERKK